MASDARRIVVVGNGGIASEIVYEVGGLEKIWVVKDDHISKAFVDAGAAEFFQSNLVKTEETPTVVKRIRYTASAGSNGPALGPDWHARFNVHGAGQRSDVTIEYEASVASLEPGEEGFPIRVRLTNGMHYDCDLVVSATGVTPNIGPFHSLKQHSDGGIAVDWKMESSVEGVFAAGDVCSAAWPWAQHWLQMRLWTQARQMGLFTAQCMASPGPRHLLQDFCFEIFSHVTKFFGYKVILLGLFNGQKLGQDYELLVRVTKGHEYVKLVMSGGRLQGCVLIGDTDLEEMCENLILNQLDLSIYGEDLLNPDIDIEDYFD